MPNSTRRRISLPIIVSRKAGDYNVPLSSIGPSAAIVSQR